MKHLIPILFFFSLILAACAGYPHEVTESRVFTEPFGLCHVGGKGESENEFLDSLGSDWVRMDFSWSRMEGTQGEFDFSYYDKILDNTDKAGVSVLAILDYDVWWIHDDPAGKRQIDPEDLPHWLNFVSQVAQRYGDRVGGFEVWNEPNFGKFWTGSDEDFFLLTRETVAILKGLKPETPVVVGSLMYNPFLGGYSYLKDMWEADAIRGADAVSFHPYGISSNAAARRIAKAASYLEEQGFDGEVWITEMGYPTGGDYPHAISEEMQGVHITKTLASSYAAGASRIIWYTAFDSNMPENVTPKDSSERFFGVAYPDQSLKSGGEALTRFTPELRDAEWAPEVLDDSGYRGIPAVIYPFRTSEGKIMMVLWSRFGRSEGVLKGLAVGAEIYDTRTGEEWVWNPGEAIPVNPEPLIITGIMTGPIGLDRK